MTELPCFEFGLGMELRGGVGTAGFYVGELDQCRPVSQLGAHRVTGTVRSHLSVTRAMSRLMWRLARYPADRRGCRRGWQANRVVRRPFDPLPLQFAQFIILKYILEKIYESLNI